MLMQPVCPFCFSGECEISYLPKTYFNNKLFNYFKCKKCELHYVSPFPDAGDFDAMYPPSYQEGVNSEICKDPYEKINGIRFSYGKQFDLIKQYAPGKRILDYGCGNANFLINANHFGFECDGTEYNLKHIELLKAAVPESRFYLLEDFLKDKTIKYDVIRLSNVLEHLTNPREIIQQLTTKLNPMGLLIVEGPVENNFTFAFLLRKMYFQLKNKLKKNWVASHVPTHIFYSNSKNQLDFFKNYDLNVMHYEMDESAWPFPEKWSQVNGIGGALMYLAAKVSKMFRPINKNWGNTFIYVGQLNK